MCKNNKAKSLFFLQHDKNRDNEKKKKIKEEENGVDCISR